jgi:hypothetical protein
MPWGKQLWDQEKAIAAHTDAAIETTNRIRQFMASFAQIQINFGKEIRCGVVFFVVVLCHGPLFFFFFDHDLFLHLFVLIQPGLAIGFSCIRTGYVIGVMAV